MSEDKHLQRLAKKRAPQPTWAARTGRKSLPIIVGQDPKEPTTKDVAFRGKMDDQEPAKTKHNMNTRSRGLEAGDQVTSEDPHNPRSSILPLEAPHNARKSAGAITKVTKGPLPSKAGKPAASDSVPQTDSGRKVTPEKLTK